MRRCSILVCAVLVMWGSLLHSADSAIPISIFQGEKLLSTVKAEVVSTPKGRALGLMFRRELEIGRGMLFIFDKDVNHPFWMKNTFISLDIIFVDRLKKVVSIASKTEPLSERQIYPNSPYRYVLEVPAGYADVKKIKIGDRLQWP